MNVTKLDYFYIDDFDFKGIGRGMLKCTNQLNYKTSPSRQNEGSMRNLNDYDSFVVPSVEIGFLYINYEDFLNLRKLLLTKRAFMVRYFDVDFGRYVIHEMYAHPDELKDFLNRGTDVMGLQNFKITLVGTLNGKDAIMPVNYGIKDTDPKEFDVDDIKEYYTVSFTTTGGSNQTARWGRSIIIPEGIYQEKNTENKLKINDTKITFIGGDRLNVFEDYEMSKIQQA